MNYDVQEEEIDMAIDEANFELALLSREEMTAEERRLADRAEIRRRIEYSRPAPDIDSTGDLFGSEYADCPLFASPTPRGGHE